jgi:diguanylate cyclase (GGDEF)-like protein/PAS domain S-box-containing protein
MTRIKFNRFAAFSVLFTALLLILISVLWYKAAVTSTQIPTMLLTILGLGLSLILFIVLVFYRKETQRYQTLIELAEECNQLLLRSTEEGIYGLDREGKTTFINPAATKMLGYEENELLGQSIHALIHHSYENGKPYPESKCFMCAVLRQEVSEHVIGEVVWRKNGTNFPVSYSSHPIIKNKLRIGTMITFLDLSAQRKAEKNLEKLALYDELTGLYNRAYFEERLKESVQRAQRAQTMFALLYIDLDNFKDINDSIGHDYGDLLLKEIAVRIKSVVRKIDTTGRLGGDEFGIVLEEIHGQSNAEMIANKIIQVLAKDFELKGNFFTVQCSIGIAYYPQSSQNTYELAKFADIAMYHAKEKGKNQCQSYSKDLFQKNLRRLEFEKALRAALDNHEFHLVYQPLYHLPDLQIRSVETLLRWQHPLLGDISPTEFIKIAEELGEISKIGLWVCEQACQQSEVLLAATKFPLTIGINVSAKQFIDTEHMAALQAAIDASGLSYHHVVLEITETAFLELSQQSLENIKKIADMGCQIAIDDFGVDYSSFNRLAELPLSALKIDAEFIRKLDDNEKSKKIVALLVRLAKDLGFVTVAEGIETKSQLDFLLETGCDFAQGFYLSKPLPLDKMQQLLIAQTNAVSE